MSLIICYGPPMKEVTREPSGERWCFTCRKRREFEFVVMAPAEPSYYGPSPSMECTTCKTSDGDLFPGREREWEDF